MTNVNKRGQITVFIIIGILILLAIGIFLYLRFTADKEEITLALEKDPAEGDLKVVLDYLSQCVEDVGTEAVVQLGLHGGYINTSDPTYATRDFSFNVVDPTNSDGVVYHDREIPYWWYLQTSNTCIQCSVSRKNIPSVEELQEQISTYVERNLQSCTAAFAPLQSQGITVEEKGSLLVTTEVAQEHVYIQISYPLLVTTGAGVSSLEKTYVELNIPLRKIYDAAFALVEKEMYQPYLEKLLLNIITLYSGLDSHLLPPLAGITFSYDVVYWVKPQIQALLQQHLHTFIPLLHMKDAFEIPVQDELEQGFYSSLELDVPVAMDNLEVVFFSDDWKPYVEITPNRGALLGPSIFKNSFPLNLAPTLQTNSYEFFYDVSFPAVVSIRAPQALNGRGYSFFFALEGNIRDNIDMYRWHLGKGTYGPWDPSFVTFEIEEDARQYPVGVDNATNQTLYGTYTPPPKTLFCDPEQRLSEDVEIVTYDALTSQRLGNVGVTYRCGLYKACPFGATSALGVLVEQFPLCVGGIVTLEKEGYGAANVFIDTELRREVHVVAALEPFRTLNATVALLPTSRLNESYSVQSLKAVSFDMKQTDSAILTLERVRESAVDLGHTQVLFLNGTSSQDLLLVSGMYTVQGLYMDNEGVVIPEKRETVAGKEIVYPEVEMNPAMLGAVYIDQRSRTWNVSSEMLAGKKNVQFYLWRMQDPHNLSDLEEMGMFENYSIDYRDAIEPDVN